jgi:biopolymer transport protein TolR
MHDELEESSGTEDVNVTPLIDVALVLVLVFLVTSPLSVMHGITIKKDALSKYGLTTQSDNVMVVMDAKGVYIKNAEGSNVKIADQEFGSVLRAMIAGSKSKSVYLEAARNVSHGQTVWVLDLAKQNGAADVSLMEARN